MKVNGLSVIFFTKSLRRYIAAGLSAVDLESVGKPAAI